MLESHYYFLLLILKLKSQLIYILINSDHLDCMIVCLFEAVRTNPGYGMAALIYNLGELYFIFARKLG